MLAVETGDVWAFSVDVTVAPVVETYTNSANDKDAYAAIVALVAWANSVARPWYGARVFSWSWARQSSTGGALLTLSATGGVFSITAGANARLGLPAAANVTSVAGTTAATGTWAPVSRLAVARNLRVLGEGDANGDGAVRPGVPGLAGSRPTLAAIGTAIDAARIAAVLAVASNPRRATCYQTHTDTWLEVALGAATRGAVSTTHYRFDFACARETL